MPKNNKNNYWRKGRDIVIILLVFGLGFLAASKRDTTSAASIWQQFMDERVVVEGTPAEELDLSNLWRAWGLLESKFVSGSETVTDEMKIQGLIEGLADSYGDPYTEFFSAEELERFNENVEGGSFTGVGIEIGLTNDGLLRVVAPLKDTPAEAAGVKAGDIILKIDDTNSLDISLDEALMLIRGEEGTKVSLTIAREGNEQPIVISIVRSNIDIPVLRTKIEDNVFIISIYSFSADLGTKFRDALREYSESSTKGLVIDLRNNPGGYLNSAVEIGSWFVPAGEVVVREKSERNDKSTNRLYRSKGYYLEVLEQKPVIVLVNQGSASASEIFAGALQDYDLATLVGESTFGKGSVQELVPLDNDTAIKITIARWLTPENQSISDGGLSPDIEIKDDPETVETDEQLEKAIAEALKPRS